ncbi:MAG TPA: putative DNA modification/repair radical SAM protein [Patescibacteria group bacterium]|nr:putative DNA modification/repair radical SAM protein [Patescibacteria group bacterium]
MDTLEKLKILGESAKYDVCASPAPRAGSPAADPRRPGGVCHSFTPDGRCISLFKVLLSNYCDRDCAYCPNQSARDMPRVRFTAEELSGLFMNFYQRNYVEGLFLSSGVTHSTTYTMQEMIKVVELLRNRHDFNGYIHLKILPGSTDAEISRAVELADRISLNMEAPTARHLSQLSNVKQFDLDILGGIQKIHHHTRLQQGVTHSTQYIVGAAGESDQDILSSANQLYHDYQLKRAYFSAFQPVTGTPLAALPPTTLLRENRLYQSDFLMRQYHFSFQELVFDPCGNLDQDLDPKLAYALRHPELYPLEINRASYSQLLRIPGVGPRSASRILRLRHEQRLLDPRELKNAGVVTKRALAFLTLNGRYFGDRRLLNRPHRDHYTQISLWG